jgi:chemotaxis protein histidine kinase CheA/ActR/RegA family two-component response regulator
MMKQDLSVSFETYYYFHLLDKIREKGKDALDQPQMGNLESFLDYLKDSENAWASIEKLLDFRSTSDLSIFFSDVLEHIQDLKTDLALEKIDSYAGDFLEMFNILNNDDEWNSYLKKITGSEITLESNAAGDSEEEVTFADYCDHIIQSKIKSKSEQLSSDHDAIYNEFLLTIARTPSFVNRLSQNISDQNVNEFVDTTHWLFNERNGQGSIEAYIRDFEDTVERWSTIFKDILVENNDQVRHILHPEEIVEAESTEDQFEMFTEPEETVLSSPQDDVVDIVERVELVDRKPRKGEFSEEDKSRRTLLQDYIIGEINSYKEELHSLLERLSEDKDDISSENSLLENLKFFKDLGQIHSYAGIELVGKGLLRLFESVFRTEQAISEQFIEDVEGLINVLPDYVRSSISSENAGYISNLEKQLSDLSSLMGAEEQLSLEHSATLKETFNEIIARRIQIIKKKLNEQSVTDWTENDITEVSSTLNNIVFWSNILKLNNVVNATNILKQLLLTPAGQSLNSENLAAVNDFIDFMVKEYSNSDEDLWATATRRLDGVLDALSSVDLSQAQGAFEEVTLRHVNQLLERIEESPMESREFFSKSLHHFFTQLNSNASLLRNESLESSTSEIITALNNVEPYSSEVDSGEVERLKGSFEKIREQFEASSYPINFDDFESYLDPAKMRSTTQDEEAVFLPESASDEQEFDTFTDTEILEVFMNEAVKYAERIEAAISKLEHEDSADMWNQIGATVHTLKGSAQMVGRAQVAHLAASMEKLVDSVKRGETPKDGKTFGVMKNVLEAIRVTISDPTYLTDEKNQQIQNSLADLMSPGADLPDETAEPDSPADFLAEDELVEHAQDSEVIELGEQDPEMLSIFNDEVSNNIELVEKHLDNIEKFAYDKSLMQEVDRSVHDICSAAKMLGLTEIGDLSERLEKLVDLIYQQRITDLKNTIPLMRKTMLVIRELTLNRKIEQQFYDEVEEQLEELLESGSLEVQQESEKPAPQEVQREGLTPQVWEAFFQEALELIDDMNYLILELEKNPNNKELRHHLMRSLHTLKGSAAMVNANKIQSLAHSSEEVLERFSKKDIPLEREVFNLLFQVCDETKYILGSLKTFQQEDTQKYEEISKKLGQYDLPEEVEKPVVDQEAEFIEGPTAEAPTKKAKETKAIRPTEQTYIRLNIDQMNHLLNLAAELVISHTQFKNQLERLKDISPVLDSELKIFDETKEHLDAILNLEQMIQDTLTPMPEAKPGLKESFKTQMINIEKILGKFQDFHKEIDVFSHSLKDNSVTYDENIQKLTKLSNELLDEIIQARLVPIQLLFKRFQRPIRDISQQFNKKINLVIKGEDTELDRSLVEELYNPLIHLIRNAIDHGLETEEERKKAEKDPVGLLEIKASRDRNQVIIEIKDDGNGIDHEKVKKIALEKGLISQNDLETMSEQDVFDLLFYPGFSTSAEVTLISGRGVGLDAVKNEIERIKGDIRVYSEEDKGTTFVIRVPISLSVIQSMLVSVSGHMYSIPLNQVEETINIETKNVIEKNGNYFFRHKAKEIPLVVLSHLLVLQAKTSGKISSQERNPIIVTFDRGNYVALLVDKIVRREEILIKSLGPSLKRLKYIIGGSIMADGHVVLVLDIPQIIQDSIKTTTTVTQLEQTVSAPTLSPKPKRDTKRIALKKKLENQKIISDRKPSILVVDDSLSIRKYLTGLLTGKGFMIEAAKNGYEALNILNSKRFDVIITDLEMPQVSGYELIETVRLDEKISDIPIIVLTGRASENFKNLTTKLGADAYIIKPFKDQELFDEIGKYIRYGEQ